MKALGFWRTLKNALASDCDEMGVQFNIGSRTLLAATRRLNDGLPSEKKNVWCSRKKCKTFDTDSFPMYGDQTKTVTTRSTQLHLYSRFNVTLDPFSTKLNGGSAFLTLTYPTQEEVVVGELASLWRTKNINISQKPAQRQIILVKVSSNKWTRLHTYWRTEEEQD